MNRFKLKAKRKYGDMPSDYEFEVSSNAILPRGADIQKKIKDLGFNAQAVAYASSGNFEVIKL